MTFTWPINWDRLPALPVLDDPPSAEYITALIERNAAASLAVQIMYRLSGRQFGLYDQVARPCAPRGAAYWSGGIGSYLLSWSGSSWVTWPCGCSGNRCALGGPRAVHLPGPVYAVTAVKIAGATLATDQYKVENNVLYRVEGPWPGQDLGRPLGEVNTWSVEYQRGIPVPPGVDALTAILATEILTALTADGECRLPRTVTTASRQGVTYRAYDPAVVYAKGKTGIAEIDIWMASVNPNYLAAAPTVL